MSSIDMTGQKYNSWTVLRKDGERSNGKHTYWICECECGSVRSITRSALISGASKSCGCKPRNSKGVNSTHGMSKTRIYHEWLSMRRRCAAAHTVKDAAYYYEKGIRVCDEWQNDFIAFRDWAYANGYAEDLTIDRIDNSKGYGPDNCRWITNAEQQANRTNNVMFDYHGETLCLRQICQREHANYRLAHQRYRTAVKKGEIVSLEKLLAPSRITT